MIHRLLPLFALLIFGLALIGGCAAPSASGSGASGTGTSVADPNWHVGKFTFQMDAQTKSSVEDAEKQLAALEAEGKQESAEAAALESVVAQAKMSFELRADGSFTQVVGGQSVEGTWVKDENRLMLTPEKGDKMELELDAANQQLFRALGDVREIYAKS